MDNQGNQENQKQDEQKLENNFSFNMRVDNGQRQQQKEDNKDQFNINYQINDGVPGNILDFNQDNELVAGQKIEEEKNKLDLNQGQQGIGEGENELNLNQGQQQIEDKKNELDLNQGQQQIEEKKNELNLNQGQQQIEEKKNELNLNQGQQKKQEQADMDQQQKKNNNLLQKGVGVLKNIIYGGDQDKQKVEQLNALVLNQGQIQKSLEKIEVDQLNNGQLFKGLGDEVVSIGQNYKDLNKKVVLNDEKHNKQFNKLDEKVVLIDQNYKDLNKKVVLNDEKHDKQFNKLGDEVVQIGQNYKDLDDKVVQIGQDYKDLDDKVGQIGHDHGQLYAQLNKEFSQNNLKYEKKISSLDKQVQENGQKHEQKYLNLDQKVGQIDQQHEQQLGEIQTYSTATKVIGGTVAVVFLGMFIKAIWPGPNDSFTIQTADGTKFDLKLDDFHQQEPFYADMSNMVYRYNQSNGQLDQQRLQDIANEYKDGSHEQAKKDLFRLLNPGFNASDMSTYPGVILNAEQTKLLSQIVGDESNNKLFQQEKIYIYSHPNATEKGLQKIHSAFTGQKLHPPIPNTDQINQTNVTPPQPQQIENSDKDVHSIFENPLVDIIGGVGLMAAIYFGYKFFTQEKEYNVVEENREEIKKILKKDYKKIITEFYQKHKTIVIVSGVVSIGLVIYLFI